MPQFLDEVSGDFVLHTKGDTAIAAIVGGKIYPEAAPQGALAPYLIYTQADGHRIISHSGAGAAGTVAIHVYCISQSQPQANALAKLVEDRWLNTVDQRLTGNTLVQVCNGSIHDGGQWFAADSSDVKMFYRRIVLRMLLGR